MSPQPPRTRATSARLPAAVAVLLLLGALAACSAPSRPNVVVIVIDTLRADHLGCYGYARPTSLRLDALADEGVRFANARAASSWTLPSVASILSGVYPAVHGAERNTSVLGKDLKTMAEAFRDAGYLTGAVSANPAFVTPGQGLARGFDEFSVIHGPPVAREASVDATPADPWFRSTVETARADEVTRTALAWVAGHATVPAPFLLYVHYFDPHAPYFPPREYAERFGVAADDPLAGAAQRPLLLAPKAPASSADLASLTALYDGEIAATDAAVGALLDGIRTRVPRPLLFVITADHGEEFGDHGGMQHGRTLWDELLHVPLVIVGAGVPRATVIEQPVSLVSLWPTLAALTGVAQPPRPDGLSLTSLFTEAPAAAPPRVFADLEVRFQNDRLVHRRTVIQGSWKLTVTPDRHMSLYDLAADPHEQHDVSAAEPTHQRFLQAFLRVRDTTARTARVAAPPATLTFTPEHSARLKALGYLQ